MMNNTNANETMNAVRTLYWCETVKDVDIFQNAASFDRDAAIRAAEKEYNHLTPSERNSQAVYVAYVEYNGAETDPEKALCDWIDNSFGDYSVIPFLRLTQDAYPINDRFGGVVYEAHAVDQDGKEYMVRWDLLPDFNPEEDPEDLSCDWDNPSEVVDEYNRPVHDFVLDR